MSELENNSTIVADAVSPETACEAVFGEGEYNMALHIGSIFIIMAVSFLGATLPLMFNKFFSKSSVIFQCAKLFGAGVILSVAWIHMQTEAVESLTNPCLPPAFSTYGAFAGAFALIGMLFTHLVQVLATQVMSRSILEKRLQENSQEKTSRVVLDIEKNTSPHDDKSDDTFPAEAVLPCESFQAPVDAHHDHSHGGALIHSSHVSVYLLELGIASHSILIGLALGVATDEFVNLLVALTFHQFFEGVALSAVVIEAEFKKKMIAIAMVVFYTLSTPIGIAIGIGISSSFNENSATKLITQGVLDGLAAGILVYDGFVNIVVPHFSGKKYTAVTWWNQGLQFFFLWLGAFAMALVGIWA